MSRHKTSLSNQGRLFVFEGPDDVGKTTLSKSLSQYLSDNGKRSQWFSFPGNEPNTLGHLVYRLYQSPDEFGIANVSSVAMQLVVTAAHVDVIEDRIKPLIRAGVDVVLDRFWWSTWVYARVEGVHPNLVDGMIELELQVWEEIRPTKIFMVLSRTPFIAQPTDHPWSKIRSQYEALFLREQQKAPVRLVLNDGIIADAMRHVISELD